jgi:hypothetical protein
VPAADVLLPHPSVLPEPLALQSGAIASSRP